MRADKARKYHKGIEASFRLAFSGTGGAPFELNLDTKLPGQGITAIFGRSGSGKTTLLRCIAGLERPHSGRLCVNGDIWQDGTTFLPVHRRPLGYVFQEASLFPHLSAAGNLRYAIKRSPGASGGRLYDRIVESMDLASVLPRRPHQLSGGERQRVAIARALLIQPRLLVMDEPLASLDTQRKQEILPYLERLHRTLDIPMLYVSHSIDEVARLADYMLVLEHGSAVTQGAPTEVFSQLDPPLRLGDDTGVVLEARIAERDGRWHLSRAEFEGGSLWIRDTGDEPGTRLRVRVLARDVSLALQSHEDSSILNRLPVQVSDILPDVGDGAMSLVRLSLGETHLLARLTNRSVHHLDIHPGSRVWAQVKSVAIVR